MTLDRIVSCVNMCLDALKIFKLVTNKYLHENYKQIYYQNAMLTQGIEYIFSSRKMLHNLIVNAINILFIWYIYILDGCAHPFGKKFINLIRIRWKNYLKHNTRHHHTQSLLRLNEFIWKFIIYVRNRIWGLIDCNKHGKRI